MAEADKWSDQRSTARKHLRKNLLTAISQGLNKHEYSCFKCGTGPLDLPQSTYWDANWQITLPPLDKRKQGVYLDANHKDKDWTNNDAGNGELLCRACHREEDRQTAAGVDPNADDLFGYATTFTLENLVDEPDPNFIERLTRSIDASEF